MFGLFISTALAQTAEAASAPASMLTNFFAPFILMIVVIYFLIIRPQSRQQKELKKMIAELKVGDEIVLISGIHGKVANVDAELLQLKIAPNIEITVDRAAVQNKKNTHLNTKLK